VKEYALLLTTTLQHSGVPQAVFNMMSGPTNVESPKSAILITASGASLANNKFSGYLGALHEYSKKKGYRNIYQLST